MVQWTTYFFVKGMTFWNTITAWLSATKHATIDFSIHVRNYFSKEYSMWYLLPNHSLPIAHAHLKNTIHPSWTYCSHTHHLEQSDVANDLQPYTIHWLSAILSIQSYRSQTINEYPLDDFLQELIIYGDGKMVPTLKEIFLLWCIDTRHWFSSDDTVLFQVIDEMGDVQHYDINDSSLSFIIKENKLIIKNAATI